MKRVKKITLSDKQRLKSSAKYREDGGNSNYARKKAYCNKNGVWGWEVEEPKPWKKALK